jgi:glycine/D-amino acid oxidase-like deaminating enzyme
MHYDIIIIGAGIVGCACARECAAAGFSVAIIERNIPGGATTAAGMGHIVTMDDSPAQLALTNYSRSLWRELVPQLPSAVEYETRGTLWIAADDEEMAEVHSKKQVYTAAGIECMILNSTGLQKEEPNLRRDLAGGFLVMHDGVLYPPAAAAFFLQQAQASGAVLLRNHSVVQADHGIVRLEDETVLHCGKIMFATGADNHLLPSLPIQKRKGHLLITDRYPGLIHHQIVELGYLKSAHKIMADSVAFNIQPRQTGQLLIGSSRQYNNDDATIDQRILSEMLERASSYIPGLANISGIRAWTGFRAATPDKLPFIGPTEDDSVILAMGFEGLGITNAIGAARLIVDQLLQRPSDIPFTPYLPARVALEEHAHV